MAQLLGARVIAEAVEHVIARTRYHTTKHETKQTAGVLQVLIL